MSTQTNNPPFPPQSSTPGAHRDLALCKTPPFIKWPSVSVTKKRFHTGDIWFRAVNVPAHRAAIGGETLRPRGWTGATVVGCWGWNPCGRPGGGLHRRYSRIRIGPNDGN